MRIRVQVPTRSRVARRSRPVTESVWMQMEVMPKISTQRKMKGEYRGVGLQIH